ncbi:MAG: protein kinase, partial [Cyanobacteria bacterium J06626_4]
MLIQTFQNGKYIVERSFDSGRFTTSYLAKKSDGERWIVKVLNPQILAGLASEEKDRRESLFWQEAIKLSKCSKNPHIAKVGMPFKEDDFICLPIEYFAGNSLAERPERCLTEQVALNYIRQIGDALDAVHREGFVHCDVCPENIHLRIRKGNVEAVLTNFELAIDSNTELSRTRTRERTDGYSPIELYSRFDKTGQRIGAYTDVYSLAATLYQLLTGEAPCSAEKRIAKGK